MADLAAFTDDETVQWLVEAYPRTVPEALEEACEWLGSLAVDSEWLEDFRTKGKRDEFIDDFLGPLLRMLERARDQAKAAGI
jgi:hypothetical protein